MLTYYLLTNDTKADESLSDAIERDQVNVEQDELAAKKKKKVDAMKSLHSNYYAQFFCLS